MLPNTELDIFCDLLLFSGPMTGYVHGDLSLYTRVGVAFNNLNPIKIDHVTL